MFQEACPLPGKYRAISSSNHKELCQLAGKASHLLLVFPLYVDGIPATLLEFLKALERDPPREKPTISLLINCGFLEPEQNEQLWGAWRWYQETGNGYTADWGAHMFDIAQAAIGMDGSGPIEFIPAGYNGTTYATMKYANGIVMTEQPFLENDPEAKGLKFIGDKGWLEVARGYIKCSDPSLLEERKQKVGKGEYEVSSPHMQNFVDCVRSRQNPIAPVEVGCSTNTLCCLQNIARELGRPVHWNPATLSFEGDKEAEAHRLYWYEYRNPYKLPYCKR